jgi:hypothetical protein
MGVVFMVIKDDWEIDVQSIKDQCTSGAFELIKELARCFLTHDLMNATKIIYPQYWEAIDAKVTFVKHFGNFENKILSPKIKSPNVILVVGLLDGALLDQQASFFTITMKNNSHPVPYIHQLIATLQLRCGHNWLQMSLWLRSC